MRQIEAIQFLGLEGTITLKSLKSAYRAMAKKYHPDSNPAGLEMMKIINAAYDLLKTIVERSGDIHNDSEESESESSRSYPEAVNAALNAIIGLDGLEIEICGIWIWVGGKTFAHKTALKDAGFRWSKKKVKWYFRPSDWKSKSRGKYTMDEIRDKFGSTRPNYSQPEMIAN